jgi:two-component system phosphate regulon sensor histidine kinase PhoR
VSQPLIRSTVFLLLVACMATAVGWGMHPVAGWLLFIGGMAVSLLYHLHHIGKLYAWLNDPSYGTVPEGTGFWDDLFALIYRHERIHSWRMRELERTLSRFRMAGQALTDSVVILDSRFRIQWCNETAERQFGLQFPEDAGQPIINLVRQPEFAKYIEAGEFLRPLELRSDRGGELLLQVQIVVYGDDERLMHVKDITQAERLDRMRQDFVANVSHELRTPLTVLSGFLETVREVPLGQAKKESYFGLMAEQSRRMQRIVEDLLTLSSIESAPPPTDERVVMSVLLRKLLGEAQALSAGRHVLALRDEAGADLLGSESELSSAFGNFVSNAIRYTPEGGRVTILWLRTAAGAEFAVEDTGIGVDKDHIPRLTERFYRVDRSRSRETGGTGLGLAIAKHALTRHQASLEITSEPGKGSRFSAEFSDRRLVDPLDSPAPGGLGPETAVAADAAIAGAADAAIAGAARAA